jgi:hypothetical protein
MSWTELVLVFCVSHLAGDYLLQTDWQARNKFGGLGSERVARRALASHLTSYTLAFVPASIWIADRIDLITAVVAVLAISLPHLIVDDGRLLKAYVHRVKRCSDPVPAALVAAVDQSLHVIMLWVVAVVVGS